jgi:hypothetical protein
MTTATPQALPGALPFTPEDAKASQEFIRHWPLQTYDDGVRTFLPLRPTPMTKPAITRLTRYHNYIREMAAWPRMDRKRVILKRSDKDR